MVMPFLFVLFFALLELALAMNASLSVNRASQNGAHIAASAGNIAGADCLILSKIEQDVSIPNTSANIIDVIVERTALVGNQSYAQQTWIRTGQTTCDLPDGTTIEVPYTLTQDGYPESQRCNVLDGCATLDPARSTVDNIGVRVRYRHDWITPLNGVLDLVTAGGDPATGGWTFEQRNIFRMEPVL